MSMYLLKGILVYRVSDPTIGKEAYDYWIDFSLVLLETYY
jgi:hypothetical protein